MKSEPSEGRSGGECDLLILVGESEWGMSGFLLPREVDQFRLIRIYFHADLCEQGNGGVQGVAKHDDVLVGGV